MPATTLPNTGSGVVAGANVTWMPELLTALLVAMIALAATRRRSH